MPIPYQMSQCLPGLLGRFSGHLCPSPSWPEWAAGIQGPAGRLQVSHGCQVSPEDAAGVRFPAQEYRLGCAFEICFLGFLISDHILIVSF